MWKRINIFFSDTFVEVSVVILNIGDRGSLVYIFNLTNTINANACEIMCLCVFVS